LYNWKGDNKKNVELVLQEQGQNTKNEFEKKCNDTIVQFAEQVNQIYSTIKMKTFVFFCFSIGLKRCTLL